MINNETVYNKWLAVTRSQRNKPFRLRQDFSNIENEEFYPHLVKLTDFFKRHPNLFQDEFFIAPFKLYPNSKGYYNLKFYASQKGLVACSRYYKELDSKGAEEQIEQVKKSYEFIGNFCLKNKILVRDYPFYKTGSYPECLIHLKDHVVSPFVIMSFPALYVQVSALCSDEKLLFFGEHWNLNEIMKKYNNSPLLKKKSLEYFHKITEIVEKKHKTS
jgi:hypothetical protein